MSRGSRLIVDDSDAAPSALVEIVSLTGDTVLTTKNGSEALAATEQVVFSLVLVDFSRPAADSRDLAQTLAARGIHTPLLVMNARADAEMRASGANVAASLVKPFDIGLLVATVDRVVQQATGAPLQ